MPLKHNQIANSLPWVFKGKFVSCMGDVCLDRFEVQMQHFKKRATISIPISFFFLIEFRFRGPMLVVVTLLVIP